MESEKQNKNATKDNEPEDTSVKVDLEEPEAQPQPTDESSQSVEDEGLIDKLKRLEDQHLRAVAELENYRKRSARQYEELMRTANDRLLADLLEVVDSFDRALAHSAENDAAKTESFADGVKLIHGQLNELLRKYDVKPIDAVGQPFDPNKHEALMQMASDEYENGKVVSELVKGYTIGDRILRHSKVSVSTGPADKADDR